MPRTKVGSLAQLPPGAVSELQAGDAVYAVCNVDGNLHCVDGMCPHAGGPLGQGTLNGNTLVCPWHEWEFDCRTGLNDSDEDVALQTYPVIIQNDEIFVDLP